MCGIFGLVVGARSDVEPDAYKRLLHGLFLDSESRGKEAAGAAFCSNTEIDVIRQAQSASELLKNPAYRELLDKSMGALAGPSKAPLAVIGHARLVTNGLQGIDANNQPVVKGGVVCVHNGIIVNEPDLWASEPGIVKTSEVDTEVVAAMVDRDIAAGGSVEDAARDVYRRIYGETSLALLFRGGRQMLLTTNTGSIFYVVNTRLKAMFFCSELVVANKALRRMGASWQEFSVAQLKAGNGLLVDLDTATVQAPFSLFEAPGNPVVAALAQVAVAERTIITNTDKSYQRWRKMVRCSRCILPQTMPFIKFDSDGVCNYCHNYQVQKLKGEEALLRQLDTYRSKNGDADCLVGFSGGRDSSYGLHLLKTKYGMNPIAYTYDWGMVTDLARRNQARLCGKLGVEHIWVSADIKQKRKNVRQNVQAWLNRPELGMVPLFMAGDKQFMWHANRLMKETGLKLMVYSTNHFERTDFKTGFCGIAPASAGIQLNNITIGAKLHMLAYYLRNYALNPGYINGSLGDTFTAFLSYYFVKQDFLYLFDYVDWNETEINRTLIDTYEWELARDTTTTWRIGDGTAPFYNYIYQTIAGFSEYETFRSNQIREGVIERDEALRLVDVENRPRIQSIREYCSLINLDFDIAMRGIDAVPKMY